MNKIEEIKKAMEKDFNDLYKKGFTTDWKEQRFVRGLEIKVMGVDNISTLISQAEKEAVEGFVEWLKEINSEDKEYLVCPKCGYKVEYWGHNQEPLYCDKDGREMVLKTENVIKNGDVSIYDLEEELMETYLSSIGKEER